jgi:hypothetical protein
MDEREIAKHIWDVCHNLCNNQYDEDHGLIYDMESLQERSINGSLHTSRKEMKRDVQIINSIISDLKDLRRYIKDHIDDIGLDVMQEVL